MVDMVEIQTVQWVPPFDVRHSDSETVVFIDLPGIDPHEVEISCEGNLLCIQGNRSSEHRHEDIGEFVRLERPYGLYRCLVDLPGAPNIAKMVARYDCGILRIRVPNVQARRTT